MTFDSPDWDVEGADWPNRDASRFPSRGGFDWHVQILGEGPVMLLLHGTGASTHSFRDLAPLLARHFKVVAPDLPGHGFTVAPADFRPTLPAMAGAVGDLLASLGLSPAVAAGHSAGAAIAARMALDQRIEPRLLVSLCGAFLPYGGSESKLLSSAARLVARFSLVPGLVAWRSRDKASIDRLVRGTGSHLDDRGVALYQRLARYPGHVAGVLAMMANWDLAGLAAELRSLAPRLLLLAGENDLAIPPAQAAAVQAMVPGSRVIVERGAGHLLHEERPEETAATMLQAAREAGIVSP